MYPDVFSGGYGPGYRPEAFMAWADSIDNFILQKQVPSQESLSFAISLLRGEAKAWWREEEVARWYEEEQLETWDELKIVMSFKYIPGLQWEEEEPDCDSVLEGVEQALFMTAAEHEVETQGLCLHVPDQTKQEEKVFVESTKILELAPALIDQGESFKSLSCGSLTWFTLDFKSSLAEHLRISKGLQQVVFEPGGNLSVSRRSNNNLAQKTVSYKLDLQGFFTPEEQDLRSNLFEGREDGVILSICSKHGGGTGGNTSLIRSITDQNKLRRAKQKLVVLKEKPKLESDYGDLCTRPPDLMQHKNQVKMCDCQGALGDNRSQLLLKHNGLVQTLKQVARFLQDIGEPVLLSYQVEGRKHADISMYEASVDYNRRVEVMFKLIKVQQQPHLEFVGIEQGSKRLLRNGKGLQFWVFDPGDDHGSIILPDLDLRTNPFEGREDDANLISFILKEIKSMQERDRQWIMVRSNDLIGELIGLIHEVLDREKAMGLDAAFIKHGIALDHNGRPVRTLVHKERDGVKLVGQEMEWVIQCDREMDLLNQHGREMSWKWKTKNQSWKWIIRIIFIIQMSLRKYLVGPGTRWIEPKKELFKKGIYRPKKWKDKPAWFMDGPIRLGTTNMVYFKCIWFYYLCKPIRNRFWVL